jgi:hypothetical protein
MMSHWKPYRNQRNNPNRTERKENKKKAISERTDWRLMTRKRERERERERVYINIIQ